MSKEINKMTVKTGEELAEVVKTLLNNGYDVAIHRTCNELCLSEDTYSFEVHYKESNK